MPDGPIVTSRIDAIFATLREEGRKGIMPFVTGGYPSLADTTAVLPALSEHGASIIEIGIPFSDPIADGPVIASSMYEALRSGVTPARVLEAVEEVRGHVAAGLVAMMSHSIVGRLGPARFVDRCAAVGIDGLIVPDIDLVAAETVSRLTGDRGMTFTMLIAPTTSTERIERLASLSSGFLYLLARTGITGERDAAPDVAGRVATVRQFSDLPIAVGFGISTAEHVHAVTRHADAAIVGSALVRRMGDGSDPVKAAVSLVRELSGGL